MKQMFAALIAVSALMAGWAPAEEAMSPASDMGEVQQQVTPCVSECMDTQCDGLTPYQCRQSCIAACEGQ